MKPQHSDDPQKRLQQFRTRWRRWVGQKTRLDKSYWVTLLDANWTGWIEKTCDDCGLDYRRPNLAWVNALQIRGIWRIAIDHADMNMLHQLDMIYATEKAGL